MWAGKVALHRQLSLQQDLKALSSVGENQAIKITCFREITLLCLTKNEGSTEPVVVESFGRDLYTTISNIKKISRNITHINHLK